MPDKVEWRLEPYKGWALDVPVITTEDGAQYTPIDRDWWQENAPTW